MAVTGLTIGVATCTSQGDVVCAVNNIRAIDSIRHYGGTTKGGVCKVTDAGGRIIFGCTCDVSYGSAEKYFPTGRSFNGIKVLSLGTGGKVEVTFR